ncbi:MAG: sensor histidine kinase [Leptolyngbya sp. DLM2.Bin15]|nr:MAG: sensor histidine kinase [Leptolyngbya sp. DLM2.Bin15]
MPPTDSLLSLESTVCDLGRYHLQVEVGLSCAEIWPILNQYPKLPGVVLLRQGQWYGMIPRLPLMELMLRSHLEGNLKTLTLAIAHSYHPQMPLCMAAETPILTAAQQALRRSLPDQSAPIVVQESTGDYSLLDAHELNVAHWQLRGIEVQSRYERTQIHMIRHDKMANLGRLVDGVAHEILDPVGFIWGNLSHIADYTEQLLQVVAAYRQQGALLPEMGLDEEELDYLQQDLPKAIASTQTGAKRLKNLASSLQNFCHMDEVYPKPADLHEALDSLVLLVNSRLNGEVHLTRTYGHLPPLTCHIGQLNQVFITLLLQFVDELLSDVAHRSVAANLATALPSQAIAPPMPDISITTQVLSPSDRHQPTWTSREQDSFEAWIQATAHAQAIAPSAQRWISIQVSRNGAPWTAAQHQELANALASDRWHQPLALSHRMIAAHGGCLRWRSPHRDGVGAAFEVLLPLV